jgi:hypothetical protein
MKSMLFYRKLIDEIMKNLDQDKDKLAIAAVRLWTSAIRLHEDRETPAFYSVWYGDAFFVNQ